jgi:hypothetical protein
MADFEGQIWKDVMAHFKILSQNLGVRAEKPLDWWFLDGTKTMCLRIQIRCITTKLNPPKCAADRVMTIIIH